MPGTYPLVLAPAPLRLGIRLFHTSLQTDARRVAGPRLGIRLFHTSLQTDARRVPDGPGGRSDGQDAVLAPRPRDLFRRGDAQPARDRGARIGGVDDVVELAVACGNVRVDVGADLLRELEPLLLSLLLGHRVERAAVDDRDRAVGTHHRDL